MTEKYIPKKVLDLKFEAVHTKIDTNHRETNVELKQHRKTHEEIKGLVESGFKGVHERQDVANHKVRKLIIAMVAVSFFLVGLGLKEARTLLMFLI